MFERFDRHAREDETRREASTRDSMRAWVAADADSPTAPCRGGGRTFAVMDYGHPGANRASANIGDHVQSIAALGHLVRHASVRCTAAESSSALLERLGERTRPDRRRDDVDADLEVITVHRDASMYQAIPRTPGPCASAGSCTRSSSCATASRCTATCGRSSSRSTATSAAC